MKNFILKMIKFRFLLSIMFIVLTAAFITVFLFMGFFGNWDSWNYCWSYLVISIIFFIFAYWSYPND